MLQYLDQSHHLVAAQVAAEVLHNLVVLGEVHIIGLQLAHLVLLVKVILEEVLLTVLLIMLPVVVEAQGLLEPTAQDQLVVLAELGYLAAYPAPQHIMQAAVAALLLVAVEPDLPVALAAAAMAKLQVRDRLAMPTQTVAAVAAGDYQQAEMVGLESLLFDM
jgi:hypothetical protein